MPSPTCRGASSRARKQQELFPATQACAGDDFTTGTWRPTRRASEREGGRAASPLIHMLSPDLVSRSGRALARLSLCNNAHPPDAKRKETHSCTRQIAQAKKQSPPPSPPRSRECEKKRRGGSQECATTDLRLESAGKCARSGRQTERALPCLALAILRLKSSHARARVAAPPGEGPKHKWGSGKGTLGNAAERKKASRDWAIGRSSGFPGWAQYHRAGMLANGWRNASGRPARPRGKIGRPTFGERARPSWTSSEPAEKFPFGTGERVNVSYFVGRVELLGKHLRLLAGGGRG